MCYIICMFLTDATYKYKQATSKKKKLSDDLNWVWKYLSSPQIRSNPATHSEGWQLVHRQYHWFESTLCLMYPRFQEIFSRWYHTCTYHLLCICDPNLQRRERIIKVNTCYNCPNKSCTKMEVKSNYIMRDDRRHGIFGSFWLVYLTFLCLTYTFSLSIICIYILYTFCTNKCLVL